MLILGGIGTLRGAVLGAFLFVAAEGAVPVEALFGALRASTGSCRSASRSSRCVALMPHGMIGLPAQLRRVARAGPPCRMTVPARARSNVYAPLRRPGRRRPRVADARARRGARVIGPNGAGKSTLVNVLVRRAAADGGRVHLQGRDVTRWPQPRRARAGIGRSYQRTTIFPRSRCSRTAAWPRRRTTAPLALVAAPRRAARDSTRACAARDRAGRPRRRGARVAGTLSHGQQRQLEIAMCLATAPQVLLLDEPLAGMGAEEAERMVALLAALKRGHAILLVEHDMDAVFRSPTGSP